MFIADLLAKLVCVLLPAYWSFKAINSRSKEDDTQWLTYWVIYSVFEVANSLFGWALCLVPFGLELKLAFLLWLQLPQFNGATVIYHRLLEPWLSKHEGDIDSVLQASANKAQEAVAELARRGVAAVTSGALRIPRTPTPTSNTHTAPEQE
jgi:receptor expression-enhancing protein 5/6